MAQDVSTELSLLGETRGCRSCQWFWGPEAPYGPFPSFEFRVPFPGAVSEQAKTPSDKPRKWLIASSGKPDSVEPAVLHGCRKAPIMTIGINPNLGGYYATPEGARYVYPRFGSDEAAYAYYYRYRSTFQEQLDPSDIPRWLRPDRALRSQVHGVVVGVTRLKSHRYAELRIRDDSGDEQLLEFAWSANDIPAVLVERNQRIQPGDVLAGVLQVPSDERVDVWATPVGYYQRFELVLRRLETLAALPADSLRIGEDVSQGDMVACASPGWSDAAFDLAKERIVSNCASDKRFALRQLLQSQPAVLVFSGRTALEMFSKALPSETWLSDWAKLSTGELLSRCTTTPVFLELEAQGVRLKTRVLCAPHFSYPDNFLPGARIPLRHWQQLESAHPQDVARLREGHLLHQTSEEMLVEVRDPAALPQLESAALLELLVKQRTDPVQMLASALHHELQAGRLGHDPATGRLSRARGGCNLCVNERWQFPEGCPYPSARGEASLSAASSAVAAAHLSRNRLTPPGGVRVWRGVRRADLSPEKFDQQLSEVFIPATVSMMQPAGLLAYQPTRLPEEPAYRGIAELALVAYRSPEAYDRAKDGATGRAYGLLHQTCFAFGAGGPSSRSQFAVPWKRELTPGQAFTLFDRPVDLQRGRTEVLVAQVAQHEQAALLAFLAELTSFPARALRGFFFVFEEGLWIRWAHGVGSGSLLVQREPLATTLLQVEASPHVHHGAAAAFGPKTSLNVLF